MPNFRYTLFVKVREFAFPFHKIEPYFPKIGRILDVGTGHGTLAKYLAQTSAQREILGIDPSASKIKAAKKLSDGYKKVRFKKSLLKNLPINQYEAIAIVDVLYLLPKKEKVNLLMAAKKRLSPGGRLLLKETMKTQDIFYYFLNLEEFLMTRVLRLTHTDYKSVEMLTEKEHKRLIREAGFASIRVVRIKSILPYSHVLFVCSEHEKSN